MNKIFSAFLVTVAVGLLVIPAGVVYCVPLVPYLIAAVVMIGILTYVKFKDKSTEVTSIKEMIEELGNQLLGIKGQYSLQSKQVYSVLEKIPQLLETITKEQEKMEGRLASLSKQFDVCNDAILQGTQVLKDELNSSLFGIDEHLNGALVALSDTVDKRGEAHMAQLENHFSELGISVDKSTEAIRSAVKGLLDELTTKLTAVTAAVTASSTAITDKTASAARSMDERMVALQVSIEHGTQSQNDRLTALSDAVSSGFNEEMEWQNSAMAERSRIVTSKIEEVGKGVSESVAEIIKELASLGLSVGKSIEAVQQSIDTGMTSQSDGLKAMAEDITSSLNTDFSKLNDVAREQSETISNVAATISDDIAKGLTLYRGIQEEVKQNIEKTLEQTSRNQVQCLELITILQNVQSKFGKDITNQRSVVEETVTKVNMQIQDSFLGFTRSLNKSNESLKEVLARQFGGMRETIEDLPDTLEAAFKSAVGGSIDDMGMSISNLQQIVEELDKFGEHLTRYEEQLNGLSKSETSIMNQFENIIRGKR